jgi:toxin-antitoxin system PIN domain toxin
MIIPDINVLLYAVDSSSPKNREASSWLEGAVNSGREAIGIPWVVHLGFLRLTTNPRVFSRPLTVDAASEWLESLESHPSVRMLNPGDAHRGILRHLLLLLGTGANLVTDSHLAALALEHNATLATGDRDFQRFPGLKLALLF